MRSFTPQISWHNRDPVLSVHFQNRVLTSTDHSVSYRLVTSGNDSHVIVWKATINEKPSGDPTSAPIKRPPNVSIECLADLTKHQRAVNVVRFSPKPEDNLLAAGDDDYVIYIWKLMDDDNENQDLRQLESKTPAVNKKQEFCAKNTDNSDEELMIVDNPSDNTSEISDAVKEIPNPFNDEEIANEIWKPYKILRGHIQDVSDVCWSPDGQRLVSASVDNTAIVWDIHKGNKLHKIVEHKGFVQGVTWDPIGKWLATLSADRNMRILDPKTGRTAYRVHRMRTEDDKTSRLFYDDTLRSFCRRLTFTPGGELLIAPSGILEINGEDSNIEDNNKYINTTYIFERKSINKPSFYLPSKKYTIAVSCCPKLFQLQENLDNPFPFGYRIVFAVATQDSVLFYDTQQSLPFAMVSQIHYLRLTDISWSPDGRMLIVSSTDGFATFITFETNEIGIPYDGPTHCFDIIPETTSPVSNTKNGLKSLSLETTPEIDRHKPKVSTNSIKKFFTPTSIPTTPEIVCAKPLGSSQNQSNCQTIVSKQDSKSPNILIPRKKIKLTTIAKPIEKTIVETIDID